MMFFDPEVGPSNKGGSVAGRKGGEREIKKCYSETKEKPDWEMLLGDQKDVTSSQKLKQPMK
jgi:hypothetical protein